MAEIEVVVVVVVEEEASVEREREEREGSSEVVEEGAEGLGPPNMATSSSVDVSDVSSHLPFAFYFPSSAPPPKEN